MEKQATFAERLKEALELRGMTKADLSRLTGISKSSLTHYERGDWEGKQDAVYKIAKALRVREAWLMGFEVTENVPPNNERQPSVSEELSEDEITLIQAYRALPVHERQHVLSLLRLAAKPSQSNPASAEE